MEDFFLPNFLSRKDIEIVGANILREDYIYLWALSTDVVKALNLKQNTCLIWWDLFVSFVNDVIKALNLKQHLSNLVGICLQTFIQTFLKFIQTLAAFSAISLTTRDWVMMFSIPFLKGIISKTRKMLFWVVWLITIVDIL